MSHVISLGDAMNRFAKAFLNLGKRGRRPALPNSVNFDRTTARCQKRYIDAFNFKISKRSHIRYCTFTNSQIKQG